ncbi:MAG: DUF6978 family protein [Candidatus Puniceispirillaceae bacterium]
MGNISQSEADLLLSIPKHSDENRAKQPPFPGKRQVIRLVSEDGRENFILSLYKGRTNALKLTYQTMARKTVPLVRLDLHGAPHRNPDGEKVDTPHIHLYREGYGDKWAYELNKLPDGISFQLPSNDVNTEEIEKWFIAFLIFCNIKDRDIVDWSQGTLI